MSEEIIIHKKALVITLIFLVILGLLFLIWRLNGFDRLTRALLPTKLEVTVQDKDTERPLKNTPVILDNQTQNTDDNGQVFFANLKIGQANLKINVDKYTPVNEQIKLTRGLNKKSAKMAINVEKATLNGRVTDFITGQPIEGVSVETKYGKATTGPTGEFVINSVPVGELEIKLTKNGYPDKTQKITLEKDKRTDSSLTPEGQIVFTSNRDVGKRGIYTANYDGSEINQLIKRIGDTEDYGVVLGPNANKLTFFSTRDKKKRDEGNASYDPNLYLVDVSGNSLILLSKDYSINRPTWSPTGKYLIWSATPDPKVYRSSLYLYDAIKKTDPQKLNDNGNAYNGNAKFSPSEEILAWTVSHFQGDGGEEGVYYRDLKTGETKKISRENDANIYAIDDATISYSYYDNNEKKTKYKRYIIGSTETQDWKAPKPSDNVTKVASPDGAIFAYTSNRDGKNDIFTSDKDGKNEKRITNIGTVYGAPVWSKGGQYLIFDSYKTAETAKYIVAVSGGVAQKITDEQLESGYYGY